MSHFDRKRIADNLTVALRAWIIMSSYESKTLKEILSDADAVDYGSDTVTVEEEKSEPVSSPRRGSSSVPFPFADPSAFNAPTALRLATSLEPDVLTNKLDEHQKMQVAI